MRLQDLVNDYIEARAPSGFMLEPEQVLAFGVAAVRFYLGWGVLADETIEDLLRVNGECTLTPSEWAVINPLFKLYVEQQVALVVESSHGLGVESIGRSSSEVAGDIATVERELPALAYTQDCFSVGIDYPLPGSSYVPVSY